MKLRATKSYRDGHGRRRYIRLYNAWRNMLARTRGTGKAGNGENYWAGKPVGWRTFAEFREWALANGYSRSRCSLDRERKSEGYVPGNCRWLTVADNTRWQNYCNAAVDPDYPDVPF